MTRILCLLLFSLFPAVALAGDGNRLAYLDEINPYYPSRTFPKLTTPMWVGEEGVEAVVILAIDDMRGHDKWEQFLRPILNRLKKIDGRAPVSIMTCTIDPKDPHLQKWLKEGLSLEVHTIDHPCPLLQKGDFARAKSTYDRCVDLLNEVPNNKPVAFRMPCCDSLNTLSPRFFAEIFNKTTPKGNFLTLDSSVFHLFTANDPDLPRDLVFDPDGRERFRKYLPADRSFVNYIEDYPYPYIIGRLCWEFPCMTPSDWQANHLHKPNNPITVRDWKAALDCTVLKQGVFTFVFHPHGWIKAEQLIDFIDYAQATYGKKVKFLTFKEAGERLNKNVLAGQPIRHPEIGEDNGVRTLDLNNDGNLDATVSNQKARRSRIWSHQQKTWHEVEFPAELSSPVKAAKTCFTYEARFGFLNSKEYPSMMWVNPVWHFDGKGWAKDSVFQKGMTILGFPIFTTSELGGDAGVRFIDIDGDGQSELVFQHEFGWAVYAWSPEKKDWAVRFFLPRGAQITDGFNGDVGLRFVDLDGDGKLDIVFSNEKEYGIYLFTDMERGWSRKVVAGKQGEPGAIPPIAINGKNNGFWVHSRTLWWQNENTDHLKDHVDRRAINDLVAPVDPQAKSPEASLKSIQVKPGFQAELMAAEPLVQSPIAFAFGPDGKLWVVEMGDYPLGIDGKGKPGGKIKFLESTKGDGKYDKATVFLENLGFPTGVLPWRNGILVTCAPDIFFVENVNGKPGKKTVLFTGFGEGNQQHRVNSLVWGLDGWLYVANGDSGGKIKALAGLISGAAKTQAVVDISGRDLRIRPDTGEIETVTGGTQYGRSRDDWGNWFGGNNSNPVWQYVLDDHYLRRNPHVAPPETRTNVPMAAGVAPVYPISRTLPRFNDLFAANRFTSACSPIVYRDTLYYQAVGALAPIADAPGSPSWTFVSEPVHNLVHREIMLPTGVTFRSRRAPDEEKSEFLASSDNWFRPTMIQTGPDGCLWIADMYRQVIEHPQWIPVEWQKKLDLRAGDDKGRIYRVVPVGVKPRAIPRLDDLDTAGLVAALDSPNGWQRDMAQMMLLWRNDPLAIQPLLKLQSTAKNPVTRLHALCAVQACDHAMLGRSIQVSLHDPHPGVRRHAVRLCERFISSSTTVQDELAKLAEDKDPQVRLQLAYTLGEWHDAKAGELLGKLITSAGDDKFLFAAAMSSVNRHNLGAVASSALNAGQTPPAKLVENLLSIATALGEAETTSDLMAVLARPRDGQFADWQLTTVANLFDSLEQRGGSLPESQAKQLAELFAHARRLAADEKASLKQRLIALRLLGREPEHRSADIAKLGELLGPQAPPDLQAAAISALGRFRDADVPKHLLRSWKSYGPARRTQVLELLLRRDEGTRAVLAGLNEKQIDPSEIDAPARQRILTHKDADIRAQAEKLFAAALNPDREKVITAFRPALSLKGDSSKGKAIFAKTCSACHKLGEVGNEVGPDLAALQNRSSEYLLIAILDPNRAVEARYVQYVAETKSGLTMTGVLLEETSTSVTVVGTDGKPQTILRTNLESLTSTGRSAMPDGLEKDLAPSDMADLLTFLHASQPPLKPKKFEGNSPQTIKAGPDGSLLLSAVQAEIYGPSLVLEKQYGNLGYWSDVKDYAVWTVDVPQAGKYAVWLNWAAPDPNSSNSFTIETDTGRLTAKVVSTGSWDSYKQAKFGELTVSAGEQRILIRSEGRISAGALFDLKSIRLVPVK
jgi:putative membrane-bound dehydrogenase-like protein